MTLIGRIQRLETAHEADQIEWLLAEVERLRRARLGTGIPPEGVARLRAECLDALRGGPRWQRWQRILDLPTPEEQARAYLAEYGGNEENLPRLVRLFAESEGDEVDNEKLADYLFKPSRDR